MKLDLFGSVIVEAPEELTTPKAAKRSPFEFIKAFGDKRALPDLQGYNAWLINSAMSMRKDTVFYANEMNKYYNLTDQMQHDFYLNGLPGKGKNYHAKYAKASKDQAIPMISDYFKVSQRVARDYLRVLTDEQIQKIVDITSAQEGGKKKISQA